jgi:hypothetical protein
MLYPNGNTLRPHVTSPYGWRIHPLTGLRRFHFGTDSVDHADGFNHAPEAGVVTFARYNGGNGNEVRIKGKTREWKLFHHSRIDVKVGQVLAQGARTGPTGTTGASTGIHCHCECWRLSTSQDPFGYIAANLGGSGASGGGIDDNEGNPQMFRLILTMKHATDPKLNLYDMFTDTETLTGVTQPEALAYNKMADIVTGTLDGTATADAKDRALVPGTRKVWARIQEANKRNRVTVPAPVIDNAAIAAEIIKLLPATPTVDEIAAKVIEYQKRAGN